jgi:hypothetical protein
VSRFLPPMLALHAEHISIVIPLATELPPSSGRSESSPLSMPVTASSWESRTSSTSLPSPSFDLSI